MSKYLFNKLSEYFQVDKTSPSGLVRIKDQFGNSINKSVGTKYYKKSGLPAAWSLKLKGVTYLVHRIIWVLTHGSISSELVIDHLDGNPFNNQIYNLSLKTSKGNSRNQRQHRTNKTGCSGVQLMTSNGYIQYVVRWLDDNGSRKSKCFSALKFGDKVALKLATEYRKEQIDLLRLKGEGYSERHGRPSNLE